MLGCVVVLVSCSNANGSVILDSSGNPTNIESWATGSDRPTTAESTYHRTEENKKRGSKYSYPQNGTYQRCELKFNSEEKPNGNSNYADVYGYIDFEIATTNPTSITIKDGKIVVNETFNSYYFEIIMLSSDTFITAYRSNENYLWYIFDTDNNYFIASRHSSYMTYYVLGTGK